MRDNYFPGKSRIPALTVARYALAGLMHYS